MKKLILLLFLLSGSMYSLYAQVAINEDGSAPDASSILDVSATDKGVLLPRVNITALDNAAPLTEPLTDGMMVYNTNTTTGEGFLIWNDNKWNRLTTTADVHVGASTMVFQAEYPGAALKADGSDNNGIMISDNGGVSANWMNYYHWWSGDIIQQDYDIALRITLPDDFNSWQDDAIEIYYQTANASTDQCSFSAEVYLESSGIALAEILPVASTSWVVATVPSGSLATLAAGETIVVLLTLSSSNDQYARLGDVSLNYNK